MKKVLISINVKILVALLVFALFFTDGRLENAFAISNKNLTASISIATSPEFVWSPNTNMLVYRQLNLSSSGPGIMPYDIILLDADSNKKYVLAKDGNSGFLQFSDNGSSISFWYNGDPYIVDLTTSVVSSIKINTDYRIAKGAFSGENDFLIYVTPTNDIRLRDLTLSTEISLGVFDKISNFPKVQPVWSPDQHWVAFATDTNTILVGTSGKNNLKIVPSVDIPQSELSDAIQYMIWSNNSGALYNYREELVYTFTSDVEPFPQLEQKSISSDGHFEVSSLDGELFLTPVTANSKIQITSNKKIAGDLLTLALQVQPIYDLAAQSTADGFDFPVGKPNATGYNTTAGCWWLQRDGACAPGPHPGQDFNGDGSGDTDRYDPVYAIANGTVVYSANYTSSSFGNIILIEHTLPDGTKVWSQYAHLDSRYKNVGDVVNKGDQIGTIGKGTNNQFWAHLHFEIRIQNLAAYYWPSSTWSDDTVRQYYVNPSDFINSHRTISGGSCSNPSPSADQVGLYTDPNYCGTYKILSIGEYSNPVALGFPNDSLSSIKVGSNVKATLCKDDNYAGGCEDFTGDDGNLSDNGIGNDAVSSAKVANRNNGSNCSLTSIPSGFSQCANEGGTCSFSGVADVIYGANSCFTAIRSFTNGTACNNDVFGDPLNSVGKACYYKITSSSCSTLTDRVRLYDSQSCGSTSIDVFPGLLQLEQNNFNDKAESIVIPSGWSARLYQNDNENSNEGTLCMTSTDTNLMDNYFINGGVVGNQATWVHAYTNSTCSGNTTPAPSANFDAWPQSGTSPLTVSMHIVSTSNITSCSWNYGDGQTGTTCTAYHDHIYNSPGTYTVTLNVSGPGGSDSMTRSNYITATSRVDSYEPDDTSVNARLISSGSPQTHNIIPATDTDWVKFQLNGLSAITLETTGATTSDTRMWLYDSSLTQVEYSDDEGVDNYSFIDRQCGVDALPAGTYYAKIDEYGNDNEIPSYTLSYNVTQTCLTAPSAPTLVSPGSGSSNPYNYDLTFQWNSSSGAIEYLVEWWGGPYSTMQPCVWSSATSCHIGTVAAGNTYSWRVKARNSAGESSWSNTWVFSIQTAPQPPSANFDAWPQNGNAPFTTAFHIVGMTGITSCSWNYGDGQTSTTCTQLHDHIYNSPGTYTVTLSVNGPGGSDSMTRSNYITVTDTTHPTQTLQFTSVGTQDGWVLESSETSNQGGKVDYLSTTFNVGDDATKKQYRGILSFSTGAALPDNAVITKVTLKVKKQAASGTGDPFTLFQGMMVDMKSGFFGTAASLATSDFQLAAGKSFGPFKPVPANGWYSFDLTPGKAIVNKLANGSGLTQIRLRFKLDDNNNTVANYVKFYSGNYGTASLRPQLIIEYYVP